MRKTFLLTLIFLFFYSPLAMVLFLRLLFRKGPQEEPKNFHQKKKDLQVLKDISYGKESYDLYLPSNKNRKESMIINIHGGAFVAGDKKDNRIYSSMLASEGYLVLVPNYSLSPELQYPESLHQIQDAYEHFLRNYPLLKKLFPQTVLMGDSAGALMAMQLSLIHANPKYQKQLNIKAFLEDLKATVLFCSPFYLDDFLESEGLTAYFVYQIARAYLGSDWKNERILKTLDLESAITDDLPAVFITDGSQNSFKEQALRFAQALKKKDVEVETLFFDDTSPTSHEYQMQMNQKEAMESFSRVLAFLERHA